MEKMKFLKFKLNKDLLPMKAHYFLYNAGTGPIVPFLSTYARQLGFSSIIVGLIYTILPLAGMFAKPLMGLVADRFKCQKVIFLGAQVLTAAAFLSIHFSPQVPVNRQTHFACSYGEAGFDANIDDKCFLDTLQRINSTIKCKMNCPMDNSNWQVICQNWSIVQYCDSHPDRFEFISYIDTSKSDDINNNVFFLVKQVEVDNKLVIPHCPKEHHMSATCSIDCDNSVINDAIAKPSVSDAEAYGLYQFWIFLFLMVAGWIGQAITVSVGDAICFELLGDKPSHYGYQRMFGSLGWGILSIISGVIVDAASKGQPQKNFAPAFYLAVAFLILDFTISTKIKNTQKQVTNNIFKDVGRLLGNIQIFVFLLWCIAVGLCTSLVWQFLFWLMEDLASAQGCNSETWMKTLEGISMAIQCLGGELPFFFLSNWILKSIGHIYAMSLVLLVLGIRFILYSVIADPWWFLPIEFTNGLTFGLFYACMASYASIIAPPGTETTVQGMVGAVFEGIGVSLGSLLAGKLYNVYGGPITFRIFGIGALIACLLHALVQHVISYKDAIVEYAPPKQAIKKAQEEQELTLILS